MTPTLSTSNDSLDRPNLAGRPRAWKRWTVILGGTTLAVGFVIGGILLYLRRTPPTGTVTVVTNPVGAAVFLDGRGVGPSPCTLENVVVGTHTIRASREGYLLLERIVYVEAGQSLDVTGLVLQPIKPESPKKSAPDEAPTERIAEFQRLADEAFARGDYLSPENDNALYFADAMLLIQPDNAPARAMRSAVRDALAKQAETAIGRGDLATAQNTYSALAARFPDEPGGAAGATRVGELLDTRRDQVEQLLESARRAFEAGRYLEPRQASAYFFTAQVLAIDRTNAEALDLRADLRRVLRTKLEQRILIETDPEALKDEYRTLARLFPEDRGFAQWLREFTATDPKTSRVGGTTRQRTFSAPARLILQSPKIETETDEGEEPQKPVESRGTLLISPTGLRFAAQDGGRSFTAPIPRVTALRNAGSTLFVTAGGVEHRFNCPTAGEFVRVYRALRAAEATPAASADSEPTIPKE
jgi:hypothetical protein